MKNDLVKVHKDFTKLNIGTLSEKELELFYYICLNVKDIRDEIITMDFSSIKKSLGLINFRDLKKYILAIIFTLLSTQITVNIMKILFARARPSITIDPDKFYGIMTMIKDSSFWKGSYVSFPSGHTITIWGTIWILSFIIKSKAIKIPLFILGILVGMSRIYLVRHWTTDVVASVILSYFIAKIIYKKINMQWYKINHLKNIIFNIKYKKRKLEVIN